MKKVLKFGKKYGDIFKIKKNFFKDNNFLLKNQKRISKIYSNQPVRKFCKVCNKKLKGDTFFNHGIRYIQCKNCSHINGRFQDTTKYSNKIYLSKSINYAHNYGSADIKNFSLRQKKIYNPKAKFLRDFLKTENKLEILDFGCGSGFFVSSLIDNGFKKVHGIEISRQQINYGKKIFKKLKKNPNCLEFYDTSKIYNYLKKTNAKCITLIGSLEHLTDMHNALKNIKSNKNIKYIYLCVPMFSLSCLIENSFSNVFNRHLGGSHTHLFTEKSLKKLMKTYGFIEKASWWFGTDLPDLHRSFSVNLQKNKSEALVKILNELKFLIDNLQLTIDKKKLSSQVHMILKRY